MEQGSDENMDKWTGEWIIRRPTKWNRCGQWQICVFFVKPKVNRNLSAKRVSGEILDEVDKTNSSRLCTAIRPFDN